MKESFLGIGSYNPLLQSDGGTRVFDPASKAAPLSNFFDGKLSRDVVDYPDSCHRRSMICNFTFGSREVQLLLSEFDPHGVNDPQACFSYAFQGTNLCSQALMLC